MRSRCIIVFVAILISEIACGPDAMGEPRQDAEEIIAAFCNNLFECPQSEGMLTYGTVDKCEEVHRDDYEERDPVCRERVLLLEECLSELKCDDFESDDGINPCSDERAHLSERCRGL